MEPTTLKDLFRGLLRSPRRRAVGLKSDIGLRWWTYAQLHVEIRRAAAWLRVQGVEPGGHVLVWAPNAPEWVASFLATALLGATVIPIDAQQPFEFVRKIAQRHQPVVLLHGDAQVPEDVAGVTAIPLLTVARHSEVMPESVLLEIPIGRETPASILYSSGTTGSPRGMMLSHGNLCAQLTVPRSWRWLFTTFRARILVLVPLSHVLGLVAGTLLPLRLGLTLYYLERVNGPAVVRAVNHNRALLLVTVPAVLRSLRRALLDAPVDQTGRTLDETLDRLGPLRRRLALRRWRRRILGSNLKLLLVGGAALPPALERFWRSSGLLVSQGYGMTETASIVSLSHPLTRQLGSIGRPWGKQEVRLSEDGEILVRGDNVMLDVVDGRDAEPRGQPERTEDGFLRTGDLGRIDRAGRLTFEGRKKDLIVTAEGLNVFPDEVEAVLDEQPGVVESCAVAKTTESGEQVHAVLILEEGINAAAVVASANSGLQWHQKIKSFGRWPGDALPRNGLLKLQRKQVAAQVSRQPPRLDPPDHPPEPHNNLWDLDEILAIEERPDRLDRLADYVLTVNAKADATPLRDLGLDSLDMVELMALVEHRTNARISETADADATIDGLRALVLRNPSTPAETLVAQRDRGRLPTGQPRWALTLPARFARSFTRRAAVWWWRLRHVSTARWHAPAESIQCPVIFAASPHWHWLDSLAIWNVLPRHLKQRVMVVTNRDFHQFFDPQPGTSVRARAYMGLAYYVVMPGLFPFAILPPSGAIRDGLVQTGRLLDKRYSLLSFPQGLHGWRDAPKRRSAAGVAILAAQTGLPIVPIILQGNTTRDHHRKGRPTITVHFGASVHVPPDENSKDAIDRLERAYAELEELAGA